MKLLTDIETIEKLKTYNARRGYLAMYSSFYGGYTDRPELMLVPIDDHMVHRGDGVFEAIRVVNRSLYLAGAHFDRLLRSAKMIELEHRYSIESVIEICENVLRLVPNSTNQKCEELMLRVFLSRGPGSFSPNPYDTLGAQLYVIATPFVDMPAEFYSTGVKAILSKIALKPGPFSQIKSCNYLPNVLMKKESIDRGAHFSLGVTETQCVAEGPTENVMILNSGNELIAPRFDYTLRGTTLVRAMELAKNLDPSDIRFEDVSISDLFSAKEVMMVGTTLGVLPVSDIDGKKIGNGRFEFSRRLHALVMSDMRGQNG